MNTEPNYNALTQNCYSTANQTNLEEHKEAFGLTSTAWAGFKQWKELGRQVKKGAKAAKIYMVCEAKMKDAKGNTYKNGNDEDSKKTVVKGLCVFNYDHTEAIDA